MTYTIINPGGYLTMNWLDKLKDYDRIDRELGLIADEMRQKDNEIHRLKREIDALTESRAWIIAAHVKELDQTREEINLIKKERDVAKGKIAQVKLSLTRMLRELGGVEITPVVEGAPIGSTPNPDSTFSDSPSYSEEVTESELNLFNFADV